MIEPLSQAVNKSTIAFRIDRFESLNVGAGTYLPSAASW